MSNPWDSDHNLSRFDLAAGLTRSIVSGEYSGRVRFPSVVEPEWFGEGWDCDVFAVTDVELVIWLCKIPKRAEVQPWIRKEADILEMFERESFALAPRLGLRGQCGSLPYEWMGISVAPGVSLLESVDAVDPVALGTSTGTALRALHSLEPTSIGTRPAHAIHRVDQLAQESNQSIASLRELLDRSSLSNRVFHEVENLLTRASTYDPEQVSPTFVHDDLFPEHLFLDLATNQVRHFIDWADASWGDPAADFTVLGWILGDPFLDSALEAYGAEDPAATKRRVYRLGAIGGIDDILMANRGAPNVPLDQRIEILAKRSTDGWLARV